MKKLIILLLVVLSANVVLAEDPVYFADTNLEAVVRLELGIPIDPIYPDNMLSLTSLEAGGKSIVYLTGLEYATNLTYLELLANQISDISPLSGLTNLTELWLQANQISVIPDLSALTSLTNLYLHDNQINDISGLSGLTNLEWLRIFNNQIIDISALSGLTSLIVLEIHSNQISDITPLSGLMNLVELSLSHNDISNITPISGLTNLNSLNLGYNQISDISPIPGMTNLTGLGLDWNQISDISAVSGLTNLTGLSLVGNQISDISAVSGLTNLTVLCLERNQISDISPLSGLTSLTDLYLDDNQISDISAVSGLTNLFNLLLDDNQISDISPISGLTNLIMLFLRYNPLDCPAYDIYIPMIELNNPNLVILWYDSRPAYCDEPDIDVSPLTWDFGDIELGTYSSTFLTISNTVSSVLTVYSLDFTTGSSAEFTIPSPPALPLIIVPGDSVDIEVVFTPSAELCYSANIEIASDDVDEPVVTVNLDGCGVIIPPLQQIVNIIQFIRDSQGDGSLVGVGNQPDKKIDTLVNMVWTIGDLIITGDVEMACQQLSNILLKCDGQSPPPDFVTGTAIPTLITMIEDLMEDLGCE